MCSVVVVFVCGGGVFWWRVLVVGCFVRVLRACVVVLWWRASSLFDGVSVSVARPSLSVVCASVLVVCECFVGVCECFGGVWECLGGACECVGGVCVFCWGVRVFSWRVRVFRRCARVWWWSVSVLFVWSWV